MAFCDCKETVSVYSDMDQSYMSSIFIAEIMLDFRDFAGLNVTFTELPLRRPPVEELEAFSILQVT